MRLVLFDVDGTLVSGGPAKDAFRRALTETFGTAGDFAAVSFSGKTDPQIARELLDHAGVERTRIDGGLGELWVRYLAYLEEGLVRRPMRVLPGVADLLDALGPVRDVAVGLLTGNIEFGARLKLGSAGLSGHFDFALGSFGSDHEERDELPAIALRRASEAVGVAFAPHDAVVVGDTPRDVACGRTGGTRTLAVATGNFAVWELESTGADHVLADLSDTGRVVALLRAE